MNKQSAGIIGAVVGIALIALSFAWPYIVPTKAFWDEQDQQVYDEAAERAHQAGHRVERAAQGRSDQEKEAAQAEAKAAADQLTAEQERFAAAEGRLAWIPRIILALGIVALLAGVAMLAR